MPLILLPDDSDPQLNLAAMSLNDLISSFNANAISEDTVLKVSKTLADVAQSNARVAPRYAQVIMYKSAKFDRLYRNYRLIWEEYLEAQEQLADNKKTGIRSNPVLADYSRKLSEEITETEMLLANLLNSGKRGNDLTPTDPEYVKYKKAAADLKKRNSALALQNNSTIPVVTSTSTTPSTEQQKPEGSFGSIDGSDITLRLKLALTLLVTALQQHSKVPLGPYIQGVREAMSSYPESAISAKEKLIHEALQGIAVPEEVDLNPILHDILTYDGGNIGKHL